MTADILRLIAGGLLAMICCYGGVLIRRHYAEREKFYTDAEAFAAYLASELGFRKTPLPTLISSFAEGRKGGFSAVLTRFCAGLSVGTEQTSAATSATEVAKLRAEEKKQLEGFLSSLGRTPLADQSESAEHMRGEFAAKRAKCAEESKRLGGMYFKLAVLTGIALLVMLA